MKAKMKITQSDLERLYEEFNQFFGGILRDNKVAVWFAQILGKNVRAIYYYGDANAPNNDMKAWQLPVIPTKYFSSFITFLIDEHEKIYGEQKFELNGQIDDEFADLAQLFGSIRERFIKGEPITKLHEDTFLLIAKKLFAEIKKKEHSRRRGGHESKN